MNVPYGGAKGGIRVPQEAVKGELERLTRRHQRDPGPLISPPRTSRHLTSTPTARSWPRMMDTYSMNVGATATGVVTGAGGHRWPLGRVEATGRGVFTVGGEAAKTGLALDGARVQGLATWALRRKRCLPEAGARWWLCKTTPAPSSTGAWMCPRCWRMKTRGGVGRLCWRRSDERRRVLGRGLRNPDPRRAGRPDHRKDNAGKIKVNW